MRKLAFLALLPLVAQDPAIVIRNVRVIDGTGAPATTATVILRGGKIQALGPNLPTPAGARIIDGTGKTLLPGLFDVHTHLNASAAPGALAPDTGKILKAYLASGVTSIVDMSSYTEQFEPLRKLIANGTMPGPHVTFAARISTPAGHGAESGYGPTITTEVASPEAAHEAMKRILPYHPDAIKVFTDGWRYDAAPDLTSMNYETLAAITSGAHAAGVKVVTHTVTLRGAKIAARAGVDIIDHGIGDLPVDDELIALLKQHHNHYGFTLSVYEPRSITSPPPSLAAVLEPSILKMFETGDRQKKAPTVPTASRSKRWKNLTANLTKLHQAGIPIGDGTDAGMSGTFHGWAAVHEIELLVKDCGYTPLEAITAATRISAEGLGLGDTRGTIAPGKEADLAVFAGNPDQDIRNLENPVLTIKDGIVYDVKQLQAAIHSTEMTPMPTHPISALIASFERADGRTDLDTLPISTEDAGADHSRAVLTRVTRENNNHAMLTAVNFGPAEHPYVRLEFPLTRGAVELADASRYSGISLDLRGEGRYRMLFKTYGARTQAWPAADLDGAADWVTRRIPLPTNKKDLRSIVIQIMGTPEGRTSLELDNLKFY